MNQYSVPESLAISDSGFLFLSSSGETFTVNELGKEILRLLQVGKSSEAIIKKILEEFDVEQTMLERDYDDFINQLISFKLLNRQ